MFNVTIFRMKDILKYTIGLTIVISLVLCINEIIKYNEENTIEINVGKEMENLKNKLLDNVLQANISSFDIIIEDGEEQNSTELEENNLFELILNSQISSIKPLENDIKIAILENEIHVQENNEPENLVKNENSSEDIILAEIGLPTEVITPNAITESFNVQLGSVKIKNETEYIISEDTYNSILNFENKNILIFQTHTCESYTPTELNSYVASGNYRTIDLEKSVAQVGEELRIQLNEYGYSVYHDQTYHDYPSYTGSYTNSLQTVESILTTVSSDIIFDIHRDAIGSITDYAPTVRIGNEEAAQLMFVIGTNSGGLWHPNWETNLAFAVKIQEKANEMYPGLFKPILLTESRYNQHTGKYASIIEVGATGNTLEQAEVSMKYLAKVIDEVLKGQ